MLTSQDVGRRVSVRREVEGGLTDVLGHLLDVTDDHLDVLARGEVMTLPTAAVTAAKVVPPATPRRGWEVPSVTPDDMQRICWAGCFGGMRSDGGIAWALCVWRRDRRPNPPRRSLPG